MTHDAAEAIADLLNGLMREGWLADTRHDYKPDQEWVVLAGPTIVNSGTKLHVLTTPAEAAEFIKEHLG